MFECVGFSKLPFLVGSPPLCFSLLNLSASSLPFPPTPGTRRPRRGLLRGRDRLDRATNWYPFFLFPSVFVSLFVLFCFSLSFLGLCPPCYGLRSRDNTNRIALIESKIWMGSCIDCSLFFFCDGDCSAFLAFEPLPTFSDINTLYSLIAITSNSDFAGPLPGNKAKQKSQIILVVEMALLLSHRQRNNQHDEKLHLEE